jgi:phospholipid-binding lipoprotein MlaA
MSRAIRVALALALGAWLALPAAPARAEGWLDWFNRGMFSFNQSVRDTLHGTAEALPELPDGLRHGVRNVATTYISEPLNATAHLIAGRPNDAMVAVQRIGVNITRGWLGLVDRAAEEGLTTNPIDFGLALCVRGVPPGPFIVIPFTGIRTVRDFLSDWVAAHVVLYGVLFGVFQMPVNLQNLAAVEILEEVITLSIAGELGEMPLAARVDDFDIAQRLYLIGRELRCRQLAVGG